MLGWLGRSVDQAIEVRRGEGVDRQLGLQAESFLRNALRYGWKRLEHLSDSTADKLNCQRGKEPPVLGGDGSVDAHVPEGKCADKRCNVANFFLSNLPLIRKVAGQIRQLREEDRRENREEMERRATDELLTIADQFDATERNPARLYNCNACLKFADLWIHLECLAAGAKDLATTNYRESQVLCPGLGIQMHLPQDSSSADGELGAEGG